MHPKKQNRFIAIAIHYGRYFLCPVLPLSVLIFLYACSGKQTPSTHTQGKVESFSPPKITVLADLPDSLQPKVTYLNQSPEPSHTEFLIPPPTRIFIDSVTGKAIPPAAQGKGLFLHYTTDEGLCSDVVHCAFRASNDELWFGTIGGGASRYDGKTFSTYTVEHGLLSNTIWCIQDDRLGNLWFATNNGLSRFDGRTFVNFTTEQGLPGNDIGRIAEDNNGIIWFSILGHGLVSYDGKSFTNYTTLQGLPSNDVWCITKDHTGNFWCGTRGGGVFYFDPNLRNKTSFSILNGQEKWVDDCIMNILEDRTGKIWIGTQNHGLLCYKDSSFTNYTTADGLICNTILTIKEDLQGALWFGTCEGICKLDQQTFISFDEQQGLTNKMVNCIIEDKIGNLWMGTYGGGIFQYGGDAFINFKSNPIKNNVSTIMEDRNGHLWFGTLNRGLSLFDGIRVTSFTKKQGLASNGVNSLIEDKTGNIWFSTAFGGGVGRLRLHSSIVSEPLALHNQPKVINQYGLKVDGRADVTNFTTLQGIAHNYVYGITEDKAGNLWFATYGGGASKFDGKSFTNFTTAQGLANNDVYNINEDTKGNLWFQYVGADGITIFNGNSFSNLTTAQGLADNTVNSMTEDLDGNLWFATEKGLNLLRAEKASVLSTHLDANRYPETPIFETFTSNDGLPSNAIYSVSNDQDGNIWVSTSHGIAFLKEGVNAFSSTGSIEIFNVNAGYPLRSASNIFHDSQGILWISTDSDNTGLVRFYRNGLHQSTDPPTLEIQRVRINSELVSWNSLLLTRDSLAKTDNNLVPAFVTEEVSTFGKRLSTSQRDSMRSRFADIRFDSIAKWHPVPIHLNLPYHHNNVSFDFIANVTSRNQVVKYQYILEGYDSDWITPTSNSSATFGNIHEGHYTFKVKARSPDGIWSEPISYAFTVFPPLHRTWWAYSLYGLMFLGLIISGHRYQKQHTIKKEQEKANQKQSILKERLRISQDLHDEVGATLSGISMYSHIAKEQIKSDDPGDLLTSLNIMQESSAEMVNKLNDIVWLLNPDQAQLHQLIEKLEAYARQLADINAIQVTVDITDKVSEIELPIEVRRNVYLIFKEAINNTIKYSRATTLSLSVRDLDHTLEITLHDNGIGFDPNTIKKGNGLDNMQKRAKEIGALITFDSSSGKGTHLSLIYKLSS